MHRWFDTLPIHRKLVAVALAVTTAALSLATIALLVVDLWQYRQSTLADTQTLAQVVAEHSVAAVQFMQPEGAADSLASVRGAAGRAQGVSVPAGWDALREFCPKPRACLSAVARHRGALDRDHRQRAGDEPGSRRRDRSR